MPGWIRSTALYLLAIVLLTLPACRGEKLPKPAGVDTMPEGTYPRVVAMGDLDKYLVHSTPVVRGGGGEPMSVSVPMRLNSNEQVRVQYRFLFLDAVGRPLRPEPDWQHKLVYPRIEQFFEATALDTRATDWRLEIRPGR